MSPAQRTDSLGLVKLGCYFAILGVLAAASGGARAELELKKGDVVAFVGGTDLIKIQQEFYHI